MADERSGDLPARGPAGFRRPLGGCSLTEKPGSAKSGERQI